MFEILQHMLLLCMLHLITELAVALGRGNPYFLNHGTFVQYNTIFTYEKAFVFFNDNATVGGVTYVTRFLENHSPNVAYNFNSTLRFQKYVLYYNFATLFDICLY